MAINGRFQDLVWAKQLHEIAVGGAGGIGSWLIFFLARIGHTLYVYDYDVIDNTNFGGQLYPLQDNGKKKVESIIKTVKDFSNHRNISDLGKFESGGEVTPITITCFDNMQARKDMFDAWCSLENRKLFIDGRMQAEYFECYAITPDREQEYRSSLFDDSEVEDLPCAAKATSHCGAMCGAMMVSLLNNYITQTMDDVASLPFKVSLHLPLMLIEVDEEINEPSIPTI